MVAPADRRSQARGARSFRSAVARLGAKVHGLVFQPTDVDTTEYDAHRRIFNEAVDVKPRLIVHCTELADVVAAVKFARSHGLKVAVKAGGHSPAGFSLGDDMVIDLSVFRGSTVNVRSREITVQGGARWADVNRDTVPFKLAAVGGGCDMVGVAGHTLGGGWGYLAREFGLAADNLISARIVTADGKAHLVDANGGPTRDPDLASLFWALQGGGNGHFGVVTELRFKLHPLVREAWAGRVAWPLSHTAEVLGTMRQVFEGEGAGPDSFTLNVSLTHAPHPFGMVAAAGFFNGPRRELGPLLKPFRDIKGGIQKSYRATDYAHWLAFHAEDLRSIPESGKARAYWKSGYLDSLTNEAIGTIIDHFDRAPTDQVVFNFEALGGQISAVASEATAYPHRNARWCWSVVGLWGEDGRAARSLQEQVQEWVTEFAAALAPHSTDGVYPNYTDPHLENWEAAYFGANYPRLQQVKQRFDPDDLFHHAHSVRLPGQEASQAAGSGAHPA